MLVYNPVFDAYHCIFRILSILELSKTVEVDRMRILDFALCFPSVVAKFKLPKGFSEVRAAAKTYESPYREAIGANRLFLSLKPTQDGALGCLAGAGFITQSELSAGRVTRTALSLPFDIEVRCRSLRASEAPFFNTIATKLMEIPLLGEDGLKHRSGLMEYRYDPI
ncbi:ABC-three component system middle component 5 [Roseateles sp.]|uniref:ABC-three component system middle component 5 n=1 Tax=Roseateles sp. TaxID=1971397 RepID=UPI0031D34AF5